MDLYKKEPFVPGGTGALSLRQGNVCPSRGINIKKIPFCRTKVHKNVEVDDEALGDGRSGPGFRGKYSAAGTVKKNIVHRIVNKYDKGLSYFANIVKSLKYSKNIQKTG